MAKIKGTYSILMFFHFYNILKFHATRLCSYSDSGANFHLRIRLFFSIGKPCTIPASTRTTRLQKKQKDEAYLVNSFTKKCTVNLIQLPAATLADAIVVPFKQPAKRTRRVKSCAVFSSELCANGHSAPQSNGADEANIVDGIIVPIAAPAKRSRRMMSLVEPFVFENYDEFQANDQNPVMQPVVDKQALEANSCSVKSFAETRAREQSVSQCDRIVEADNVDAILEPIAEKENESLEVVSQPPMLSGLTPLAEQSDNKQPGCLQCFIYKQNNIQLKKKIATLNQAVIKSKQSYTNSLRKIQFVNAQERLVILNQLDELQDRHFNMVFNNNN